MCTTDLTHAGRFRSIDSICPFILHDNADARYVLLELDSTYACYCLPTKHFCISSSISAGFASTLSLSVVLTIVSGRRAGGTDLCGVSESAFRLRLQLLEAVVEEGVDVGVGVPDGV